MSSAHDDLLRRADRWLSSNLTMESNGEPRYVLIRDLRDALVAASTLPDAVRADIRLMTRSVGKHSRDDYALDAADRLDAFLAAHQPLENVSEQPALSRADAPSTSLADRGSNESAPVSGATECERCAESEHDHCTRGGCTCFCRRNESALRAKTS